MEGDLILTEQVFALKPPRWIVSPSPGATS